MQLMLKNHPILKIEDNGECQILDFDRLPFALRKEKVTFVEFMEWAGNRTLSIGRSYAKEIMNSLRVSQTNRYAVCKACRGLTLTDAYWIRQDGDEKSWEEVNLFQNPLALFVTEISLSGRSVHYQAQMQPQQNIHTPELTTMGASAKGWIRGKDGLRLHKVGKYEIPADEILSALGIEHISYRISSKTEIESYLTLERREWLGSVEEKIVNSRLFTSEKTALVTFEEFKVFCESYGMDAYEEAVKIDRAAWLKMQIADYILNNNDRHEQNWGFLMDNESGKLVGVCPLFDHDHAFAGYEGVMSQTNREEISLLEAAQEAYRELQMELQPLWKMSRPDLLSEEQWTKVLERADRLTRGKN